MYAEIGKSYNPNVPCKNGMCDGACRKCDPEAYAELRQLDEAALLNKEQDEEQPPPKFSR